MHLVSRIWKQTYGAVEWGRNDRGVQSNSVCKWKNGFVIVRVTGLPPIPHHSRCACIICLMVSVSACVHAWSVFVVCKMLITHSFCSLKCNSIWLCWASDCYRLLLLLLLIWNASEWCSLPEESEWVPSLSLYRSLSLKCKQFRCFLCHLVAEQILNKSLNRIESSHYQRIWPINQFRRP